MKSMLFATILILFAPNARANEMEEQIFEVSNIKGAVLSESLIGFTQGADIYLPFLDLGKVLGVRIEQSKALVYEIYKTEKDFYTLDYSGCPSSKKSECQRGFFNNGVFYLKLSYLIEDLGWPLEADLKSLRLLVKVDARSQVRPGFEKNREAERPIEIIRKKYDYPAAAVTTTFSSDNENNSLALYESQPLWQHDSDFMFSLDNRSTNTRWTLSKELVDTETLGTVKNYEVGSTQTFGNKYLFSPTQVTGAKVSNIRDNETIFDTQTLTERGPPRWKVELYLNDIYFGETVIDANGLFSFTDVPLFYGQNRVVYRLTSPLGQSVEIKKDYNISSEFQGAGRFKYQIAYGQELNSSSYTGGASLNLGLFSFLSAQAGVSEFVMPGENTPKKYHLAGASFLQPQYSFSTTRITSFENDEAAWVYTPRLQILNTLFTVEHARFEKFKTALINPRENDDMQTRTGVAALTHFSFERPLTVQVSYQKSEYGNLSPTEEVDLRGYMSFSQSSILVETSKIAPFDSNPDLYVEGGSYSKDLRQKLGALIQNDRHTKTRLNTEYALTSTIFVTAAADIPTNGDEGAYALGASTVLGELQSELNTTYSKSEVVVNLTLSTNIKWNEKGFRLTQAENYRQCSIEIFAFVDDNSNDIFDPGEKPFPRLKVTEVRQQKDYETDESGITVIPAVNPYERVRLQVVKESIANIYLTARDFQSDFILTPAQQLRVNIPVKPSFDIKGDIKNPHFKKLVPIEVIDNEGKLITSTLSMSSGHFKVSDLPGGNYFIRVSPKFLTDNALTSDPELLAIDLSGKAGLRPAGTLTLRRK